MLAAAKGGRQLGGPIDWPAGRPPVIELSAGSRARPPAKPPVVPVGRPAVTAPRFVGRRRSRSRRRRRRRRRAGWLAAANNGQARSVGTGGAADRWLGRSMGSGRRRQLAAAAAAAASA